MEQSSTDYSDDESGASYIESTDDEDYISDSYSNQFYKNNSNTNISSAYSNNRDTEKLVKVKNPHRAYNKASDLASMRSKTSFVSIRKSLISNYENNLPQTRPSRMSQSSRFSRTSILSQAEKKHDFRKKMAENRIEDFDDYGIWGQNDNDLSNTKFNDNSKTEVFEQEKDDCPCCPLM